MPEREVKDEYRKHSCNRQREGAEAQEADSGGGILTLFSTYPLIEERVKRLEGMVFFIK